MCRVPRAVLERALLRDGRTYADVGAEFDWDPDTVRKRCRALGIPSARPPGPPLRISDEAIIAGILAGRSLGDIARRAGVSRMCVHLRAVGLGLPTRHGEIAAYAAASRRAAA